MAKKRAPKRKKRSSKKRKSTRSSNKSTQLSAGVIHKKIAYKSSGAQETSFKRADVIISGVPHRAESYEVRLFLNNKKANAETPRSVEQGYAGRFVIFGHGGCFGGAGHCAVPERDETMISRPYQHPLDKKTIQLTITDALEHVLDSNSRAVSTVTMVTTEVAAKKKDCGPADGLFDCEKISLNLYG